MSSSSQKTMSGGVDQLIALLEPYFTKKAPFQLPQNARDWIAEYAWLVSLVVALLSLPAVLALLGMMGVVGTLAASVGVMVGPMYWLSGLAMVVQVALMLIAVPGLKAHSYQKGWKYVFYGEMFSALYALLSLSISTMVGTAIGLAIGLFILYQVKPSFR